MHKKQPITIDGVTYESLTAAAKAHGVTVSAISLRLKQGKPPRPLKVDADGKVSLRIDSRTVIMVTPDKATQEYAELWKARHEASQKGDRHDWIDGNEKINRDKKQRVKASKEEKRQTKKNKKR